MLAKTFSYPFCRKVNIVLVYHVCILYLAFFMYGQPWCFCHVKFQVREMVAVLDLDVLFYPCPQKGPTFRPKVLEMGGKKQFPYMVCKNSSPVLCFVRLYVIATISNFTYLSNVVSELCLTNKHDPSRITNN